jgi:hypothetical protein
MPESWFCESCGSLNRGNADRCYRCKSPKAQGVAATTREQRPVDALFPGADKVDAARAAAQLAPHSYIDPSLLGYLAVVGFTILFAAGLATLAGAVAALLATVAPDTFKFTDAMRRLTVVAGAVTGAGSILAVVCHSAFLWLTTRNVPALAGGMPRFGSRRALAWWIEAYLWQVWALCVVWVVPGILLLVVLIVLAFGQALLGGFGFLGALFAIWYFGRYSGIRIDFPQYTLEVLRKPARLLEDLTERLAAQESPGRRLVSLWSTSWVTSAVIRVFLPYLVLGLWVFIVLLLAARAFAGLDVGKMPSESDLLLAETTFVALMGLTALLTDLLAVFFIARVTLALTDAQRKRHRWLVEGDSLPPNQFARQAPQPAPPAPEPNALATPAPSAPPSPAPRPAGAFTGFGRGPASAAGPLPEAGPLPAAGPCAPSAPQPEVDRPSRRPDIPPA